LISVVQAAENTRTSPPAVLAGSRQFFDNSGATLDDYLAAMQQIVLGTALPQPNLRGQLAKGVLPASVAEQILQSNVGKAAVLTTNFQSVLARSPNKFEQFTFVQQLNEGVLLRDVIASLLAGSEFYRKATNPSSS
jgi:hypothetical protein